MSAAQDTDPAHQPDIGAARKFQLSVVAIGGLLASVVGVLGKENLTVSIGFVVVVVLGVLMTLFFDKQARDCQRSSAQQIREIAGWRRDHQKCSKDLHERDILIAMLFMHIRHDSTQSPADRRKGRTRKPTSELEAAFHRVIGAERAGSLLDDARKLLLEQS